MDALDQQLLDAWHRISLRCRRDRLEALRRSTRRFRTIMRSPPVAWCLRLRSSDTRIMGLSPHLAPDDRAPRMHRPHTLGLDGQRIAFLCKPVRLPWPGVTLEEAARRLGRTRDAMRTWLPVAQGRTRGQKKRGDLDIWREYSSLGNPIRVTYEKAQCHNHFGHNVPVIWSTTPLDPGAGKGQPPHAIWGSLWQSHHESWPIDRSLTVRRIPRHRTLAGREVFRGWDWLCPGRDARPCGRICHTLYCPLPVHTIAHLLNDQEGIDLTEQEAPTPPDPPATGSPSPPLRLVGRWFPGQEDPLSGRRTFACKKCWNIRGSSLIDPGGWNRLIAHLSGGLLYGHEVPPPQDFHYTRKKRYAPRPHKRKQDPNLNALPPQPQERAG